MSWEESVGQARLDAAGAEYRSAQERLDWARAEGIERTRPSTIYAAHLKICIDGDKWCALFGENLQDGVAGFGESPYAAMRAFDIAWNEPLKERSK